MKPEKPRHCSVCGREPVEARGLCHTHYRKWRRGAATYDAPLMRTQKNLYSHCTVDGCDREHYAKGWCYRHYQRVWAGNPLEGGDGGGFPVGEAHPNAKLTADQVREIRTLHREGIRYPELAARFGVGWDTVRRIVIRRTWKHI
jgi:hypothetical protein